ncbi:MAG: hypothetical protein J6W69_09540 [Bacteroidales bacterium]|nr:hypothetical protein [Bacteroidales bacterium]
MRKSTTTSPVEASAAEEQKTVKRSSRTRKKAQEAAPQTEAMVEDAAQEQAEQAATVQPTKEAPVEAPKTEKETEKRVKNTVIPPMPRNLVVRDIVDLWNARIPMLNDQQIQQITLQEAQERHLLFEAILTQVLDYDIVVSDTNIWLELLIGHTSSHSDPKVNARLMFERQLEFISKMMKKRGGRFMIMAETYEEIDRFACQQEPTNYQEADWTDPLLCRNVSARLAKRLILCQQRENRLRIEGVTSESHHGSFADPAIIRRVVELFASGKKVLLMTNDASVAIRSLGMCDDLQRINGIDDATWDRQYAPLRPMAITMDDLKQLDNYTRQYHFLMSAAGATWMQDLNVQEPRESFPQLKLDENAFRPGDKHERRSDKEDRQRIEQQKEQRAQEQQKLEQQRQQLKAERQQMEQQRQQMKAERQQMEQQRQQLKAEQKAEQRRQQQRLAEQRAQEQSAVEPVQNEPLANAPAEPIEPQVEETPVVANAVPEQTIVADVIAAPAEASASDEPVVSTESSDNDANAMTELPAFSPEDMELLSSAPKKRTHRGGRRRGGKTNPQA